MDTIAFVILKVIEWLDCGTWGPARTSVSDPSRTAVDTRSEAPTADERNPIMGRRECINWKLVSVEIADSEGKKLQTAKVGTKALSPASDVG